MTLHIIDCANMKCLYNILISKRYETVKLSAGLAARRLHRSFRDLKITRIFLQSACATTLPPEVNAPAHFSKLKSAEREGSRLASLSIIVDAIVDYCRIYTRDSAPPIVEPTQDVVFCFPEVWRLHGGQLSTYGFFGVVLFHVGLVWALGVKFRHEMYFSLLFSCC